MKNKLLQTLLPALLSVAVIASGLWIPQQVLAYRKTLLLKSAGTVQADALTIFNGGEVSARLLEDRLSKLSELIREYKDGGYSDDVLSAGTREPLDTELNQENAIEAAQLLQVQFYQEITTWRHKPDDSTTQQSNVEEPAVDAVELLTSPADTSLSLWYADTGACRMAFDALSGVPVYFSVNLEAIPPAESGYWIPENFCLLANVIYNTYRADGQYFTFPLSVTTVSPVVSPVDGSNRYTYESVSAQYLLSVSVLQVMDGTFTGMEGWLTINR